ncbi:hypothetical protein J4Q44_G00222650 [Coregonus suidteri]|uniref:Uncharacterized protein n=1 Tax=Coregonus suidteri TaxID=861788 RepID=A0AAN8QZ76_9TELE
MAARKKNGLDKRYVLHGHPQGDSPSPHAKGLYQPSVIFMGRQTSRESTVEDATISVHLQQAEHHSPQSSLTCLRTPAKWPFEGLQSFQRGCCRQRSAFIR